MSLTRKHFKQLAEHIKNMYYFNGYTNWNPKNIIDELILFCKKNNPKFNEAKFREAIKIK